MTAPETPVPSRGPYRTPEACPCEREHRSLLRQARESAERARVDLAMALGQDVAGLRRELEERTRMPGWVYAVVVASLSAVTALGFFVYVELKLPKYALSAESADAEGGATARVEARQRELDDGMILERCHDEGHIVRPPEMVVDWTCGDPRQALAIEEEPDAVVIYCSCRESTP